MTARAMVPAIGCRVDVRMESLTVRCRVADVKESYGRPRLLVRPEVGTGEQWVELGRVSLAETCGPVHGALVVGKVSGRTSGPGCFEEYEQ